MCRGVAEAGHHPIPQVEMPMSYQVLARKWRPDSFESLAGQSHVVRALTNGLDQQRLHHAYLFTGTRGVGKTTLGRILAKCLNCETGITSKPCNTCQSCQEIASGRFIDLIEVDAASRTKVEDTRELLENVSYAPTTGRFKVYLIDEVHMLSTHSFNALLKTLEEPPPHVKFFLATTDPQKLPITVLSRCLQFHLKCLSQEQITSRLAYILQQEKIDFEEQALTRLAHAAEGSMRDALSLLDQAIAFGEGKVTTADIKLMLSTIEATHIYEIIDALADQKAEGLIGITQNLAEQSVDFANVLEELLSFLHQIALGQFVTNANIAAWDKDKISLYAKKFSAQDIQLFYQIALIGRKDLALAPTPRIGLEMVLLRMLAFQPSFDGATQSGSGSIINTENKKSAQPVAQSHEKISLTPTLSRTAGEGVISSSAPIASEWQNILPQLNLSGMTAAIAQHCQIEKMSDQEIILAVDPSQKTLLNKKHEERLAEALQSYFKRPIHLTMNIGQTNLDTPALRQEQEQARLKSVAKESIQQDPNVKKMIETFGAKILPDSIDV